MDHIKKKYGRLFSLEKVDLTKGSILGSLFVMAAPIAVAGFIQMTYNFIDMFWVGRLGAKSVAAIGAAATFIWLADALVLLAVTGGQIKTGFYMGAGKHSEARSYIKTTLQLGLILGVIYSVILLLFPRFFISLFGLKSEETIMLGISYMKITGGGIIFYFLAKVFTSLFSAIGNTKIGLIATSVGLVLNIILDPIMIFYFNLGVRGAAVATVFSQMVAFFVFIHFCRKEKELFSNLNIFHGIDRTKVAEFLRLGMPRSVQTLAFVSISIFIGRMISSYGENALAAQKIGVQIEAITWMTAGGFEIALNAFVAQNYGAGNINRIRKGYGKGIKIMSVFSIFTTLALVIFSKQIMQIFLSEKDAVFIGSAYLKIVGLSQFFMCLEILTSGAFAGFGITFVPNFVRIVVTSSRVLFAPMLSAIMGLDGIWVTISLSSIVSGSLIFILFIRFFKSTYPPDRLYDSAK